MKFCYKKVALLVLSFCTLTAFADHHTHDHNHGDSAVHKDVLTAFDHHYHEYHHHHPVVEPNCGQVCPKSISKYGQFEIGQVYTVDVDGQTLINVKEGQTIGIKTKADVQVITACEFALTLRESEVTGVPNSKELGQQLDNSPVLRFGAHDGVVLGVCAGANEENWTLNVKKSILSAMQLTTKDLASTQTVEEVDFSGHCTTTYRPMSDIDEQQKNVLLEKTKNLNKCHLRRKNISGFSSKSLTLLTEFLRENLPILESNQRCLQEIKGGHLFSVSCTEDQKLSFQDNSIVKSTLNLRFGGKAPAAKPVAPGGPPQNAQTLLMSRDDEEQKVTQEADVLALLRQMCAQVGGDRLSPEVTESFHSLITALRTLPESATKLLDKATKTGEICQSPRLRQLFLGASGFASSDPSIQTIISAFNSKELSGTQITLLLSLVALKTKPSEKTIDSMVALIEPKDSPRPLVLSLSLMIKNFCKKQENCEQLPAVKKTVDALLQKLKTSDCNLEKITVIKALDNIRPKTDSAYKTALLALAEDSAADIGVRVAAIQALHCCADDSAKEKLIELLKKSDEPSEVRITAYRTVIQSGASAAQLEKIRAVSDPQIQNYIQTHIKNLKKTTNQNRRNLLPSDAPEFEQPRSSGFGVTRNLEFSYKGSTVEADVIHPKGSVVPSLLTLGVWFPVGGKDYQLLEVQLRQQGLEEHIKKVMAKGLAGPEILMQLSEELLELSAFLKDPEHKHTAILQLSVRMSGRNVLFIDTFEDLHEMVRHLKERIRELYNTATVDQVRALSLLDSQVEVPTINGFPMLVHLNETIVLAMKAVYTTSENAGTKTRKFQSTRSYLDELSAGLNLKVRDYRPGFEYHVRFEMSPASDGQVEKSDNGRVIKAKINLPNERRSLMKVTQSTRIIDATGLTRESNEISGRANSEDNTQCRQIFGLNVCRSKTWLDNSPIPNIEYYFTKEDPTLESIELTLERPLPSATRDHLVYTAKVNAGKREYLAQFDLKNPREGTRKVSLKLVSPRRTITADAQLLNTADGNSSKLEVDLKIPDRIDINTKVNAEVVGEQRNLEVVAEYQLAGADKKESVKVTRKTSMNMKKDKKTKQINVSYFLELQSTQFPNYNSKVSYYTNWRPYQTSKSDLTVEWGPALADRVRVQHVSKMDVIELRPFQMTSEVSLTVEATPLDLNQEFKLSSDISMLKSKPKLISFDLVGKDVAGRADRDINAHLKYERTEEPKKQIITNASLSYPGRDMTYYSEITEIKDLSFAGKMIYSPQKGKTVTVEHKQSITNPTKDFHFDVEADVTYSWKPEKYEFKGQVGWKTPEKFEYQHTYSKGGQKESDFLINYDKTSKQLTGQFNSMLINKQGEFKVDNVNDPRLASWGVRSGQKSYKMSAIRVPKESIVLKLDSAENTRLKEFKMKIAKKEKSSIKLVTKDNYVLDAWVDPPTRGINKMHLEWACPKYDLTHTCDITANRNERKIIWSSKTNKGGKPWLTGDGTLASLSTGRSSLVLKKIKGPDAVSKLEYFYEKGTYAATVDTSRFSAIIEGENRNNKRFGKIGFVNKEENYEHKSLFNISNGVLTIKSVSDQEKQTFSKLDAVIGRGIISNVSLVTPTRNGQLTINPLGEKKTLVLNYVSPKYDQSSNVEWVRGKYMKIDSLSQRKVDPKKRIKVDAYLTRQDESSLKVDALPEMLVDIRRVKTPKPKYVFNTTLNGYNEVQEFDSNPSLPPTVNFMNALGEFYDSYKSVMQNSTLEDKCSVTEWSVFSSCSAVCGPGVRIRKRQYTQAVTDASACNKQLVEEERCDTKCVNGVSCATTEWTDWNSCSALCGKGFQTRTRKFINRSARISCGSVVLVEKTECMGPLATCPRQTVRN